MEQVSRMTAEVNKLIGASLLAGNAVYIPEVGSLYIIVNPEGSKRVDFSSAEQGVSLVEIIKDRAGCTPEQATEIFSRWIEEVRAPKLLVIAGVGELRIKTFVAEESFAAQLNTASTVKAVPVTVAVAPETAPAVEETVGASVEETPAPAPKKESKAAPKAAPAKPKKSNKGLWIALVIIVIVAVGYCAYDSHTKAVAEEARIAAIAQAKAAEQKRVADSIAMAEIEAKRLAEAEAALLAAKRPRYRVVYGVYELRSNVDEAIKDINAQYGDDSAHEYPFGALTMVSMFESDARSECQKFLMEYYDLYPDAWVHDSEQ